MTKKYKGAPLKVKTVREKRKEKTWRGDGWRVRPAVCAFRGKPLVKVCSAKRAADREGVNASATARSRGGLGREESQRVVRSVPRILKCRAAWKTSRRRHGDCKGRRGGEAGFFFCLVIFCLFFSPIARWSQRAAQSHRDLFSFFLSFFPFFCWENASGSRRELNLEDVRTLTQQLLQKSYKMTQTLKNSLPCHLICCIVCFAVKKKEKRHEWGTVVHGRARGRSRAHAKNWKRLLCKCNWLQWKVTLVSYTTKSSLVVFPFHYFHYFIKAK